MATLGSLVVSLEANIAKFQSDLGKAVGMADSSMSKIGRAVQGAKSNLEGMAAAFGIEKIAEFGLKVIENTGRLAELSIQTGLSVEALSALKNEAKMAGTDLDSAAGAFDKMQKLAFQAAGGSAAASQAFASIGVSATQLAEGLKNPDELLKLVSERISQFKDDGNKTALMMTMFGKSGASMNELLGAIAANGFEAATATAEQAKQAKEAADAVEAWRIEWEKMAQDSVVAAIPAITKAIAFIKVSFAILATNISTVWATMKMDAIVAWNVIVDVARNGAADLAAMLPESALQKKLAAFGAKSGDAIEGAISDWKSTLQQNERIVKEAMSGYMDSTLGVVSVPNRLPTKTVNPPQSEDAMKSLQKGLDSRIKMIDAAIKGEEIALQIGNKKLDNAYDSGLSGLADYSAKKAAILEESFRNTQALYDAQIAMAETYLAIAKDQASRDATTNKIRDIADKKQSASLKHDQDEIALTDELTKAGQSYAKALIELDVQYSNLTGNTARAVALQIEMEDALLRSRLAADGNAEALSKLDAIESDRMLRAAKDPLSGITRSVIDYQKSLEDVGKSTEEMVGKTLGGMEDALTEFVAHGKLNFRSLIDSMLVDLARYFVRQQIMAPLLKAMSASSGIGSFISAAFGGGKANGGPVTSGTPYMVGERGPEMFIPNNSGTIVPNGTGGGGSPNINLSIDARGSTQDAVQMLPAIAQQIISQAVQMSRAAVRDDMSRSMGRA